MDKQTEYAGFLGVDNGQLNRWEQQKVQPGLETMYRIWKHLKTKFPEINMQDLIEDESPWDGAFYFWTVMYQYKGEGQMGANANFMFQENKLQNKAQFGLE